MKLAVMSEAVTVRVLAQFRELDGHGMTNRQMTRALGISLENLRRIKALSAQRDAAATFAAGITDRLIIKLEGRRASAANLKSALLAICEEMET